MKTWNSCDKNKSCRCIKINEKEGERHVGKIRSEIIFEERERERGERKNKKNRRRKERERKEEKLHRHETMGGSRRKCKKKQGMNPERRRGTRLKVNH